MKKDLPVLTSNLEKKVLKVRSVEQRYAELNSVS